MKPETILNAMGKQGWSVNWPADLWDDNVAPPNVIKARRQYRAFRNRILKMFDDQEDLIDSQRKVIRMRDRQIRELESTLEKCLELATVVDRERKDHMLSDMRLGWKLAKEILDEVKNG